MISDLMCSISLYTTVRCSAVTYLSCSNNSHRLSCRSMRSSRSSHTANVCSWKATADVVMSNRAVSVRSMCIFNRPVWAGKNPYVHFFIYGGILALPYQSSHHAHKIQCDHGQIFFLFITMPTSVIRSESLHLEPH